jgi:HTH-type transcriptional regulator/antitoxin HigA
LVKDYDVKHYNLPELDAMKVIKYKMQEMGIKGKDLESITQSKGHVSAIFRGKREIRLKMDQKLKNYFSIPAEVFCIVFKNLIISNHF